jgi:hypothetical protein
VKLFIGKRTVSNDFANDSNINENLEWELSDLVDAIAAEIDEAQNTLSLKSHVRDLSFSIKTLSLDIEVKVRRTADGKYRFRTINPDEVSATVLKLDFAQVIQSQLTHVRKPVANPLSIASVNSLEFLPDISPEDIKALGVFGITSVDDLERYPKTPQMLAELSRKTRIDEYRIWKWQKLPFLTKVNPDNGSPGSTVIIEGGNFGSLPNSNIQVFFQKKPAKIKEKQETRLIVEMPLEVRETGPLVVQINDQISNPLQWRATKALSKLEIGDYRTIESLDPVLNPDLGPAEVMSLIFRGLAYINPDGVITPDIAKQWEILPSIEDPQHFTVHLHDQIYFHNEDLLTAADVKFTYEKILESKKSPWQQLAQSIIEEIKVEDQQTIDFVLNPQFNKQSLAGLIVLFTIGILPRKVYQSNPDRFAQKPIGCGAFQLQNFVPRKMIELTAFPRYLQGKPKLDQICIHMGMKEDELMQMIDDNQPIIANFNYSEKLESSLSNTKRYIIKPIPAFAPILNSVQFSSRVLTIQSHQIQERFPNQFNSNWNAHLWYLKE